MRTLKRLGLHHLKQPVFIVFIAVIVFAVFVCLNLFINFAHADDSYSNDLLNNNEESNLYYSIQDEHILVVSPTKWDDSFIEANSALAARSSDDVPWLAYSSDIYCVYVSDDHDNNIKPLSMHSWFALPNCEAINDVNSDTIDTSALTCLDHTFSCPKLSNLDLSTLSFRNVTSMIGTFATAGSLTQEGISISFKNDRYLTGNVLNMSQLFKEAKFYRGCLDISSFSNLSVTNIDMMFYHCDNLRRIYANSNYWLDLSSRHCSKSNTFQGCSEKLEGDFNGDIFRWNPAHVDGNYACVYDPYGKSSIGYFSEGKPPAEDELYFGLNGPILYLSPVPTSNAYTNASQALNSQSPEDVPWHSATRFILSINISSPSGTKIVPKSMAYWFDGCNSCSVISGLDNNNFDFSQVASISHTFHGLSRLEQLDLSGTPFVSLVNMESAFEDVGSNTSSGTYFSLGELWDTSKVITMESAFRNISIKGIYGFSFLDLSSFSNESLDNIEYMFADCKNIGKIFVDPAKWIAKQYPSPSLSVFADCSGKLFSNKDNSPREEFWWQEDKIDGRYACAYIGDQLGYFTAKLHLYYGIKWGTELVLSAEKTDVAINDASSALFATVDNASETIPWFSYLPNIQSVSVENRGFVSPLSISCWFMNASQLEYVSLRGYIYAGFILSMDYTFYNCSSLTNLSVNLDYNLLNLKSMNSTFCGCTNLDRLTFMSFRNGNLEDVSYAFSGCKSLRKILVSTVVPLFHQYSSGIDTFKDCNLLVGEGNDGSVCPWEASHIDATYANPCSLSSPGYFSTNWE